MGKQSLNSKAKGSSIYVNLGLESCNKALFSGPPKILPLLSSVLERNIQKNENLVKASGGRNVITIFHGSRAPAMSIQQYLERVFKYARCSPSCFVVAYIYMERFLQQMDICLTSLNVHRILITSIILAAKYLDDECYNNVYYAELGGVSTEEMNRLEMKFLVSIDFRLHVTVETFNKYCSQLDQDGATTCMETSVCAAKKG